MQKPAIKNGKVTAELAEPVKIQTAVLNFTYTTDEGPNPERKWQTIPLEVEGTKITRVQLHLLNTKIWFINVTDETGPMTSSSLMHEAINSTSAFKRLVFVESEGQSLWSHPLFSASDRISQRFPQQSGSVTHMSYHHPPK